MGKWIRNNLVTILLAAAMVIGVVLLAYPSVANYWNSFHQTRAIMAYGDAVADMSTEDYSKMMAFEFYPLKLRSTSFFDKIEEWYETFDVGTTAPRDEVIIRQSSLEVLVNNPIFMPLKENERFIHLVNRIGGCKRC